MGVGLDHRQRARLRKQLQRQRRLEAARLRAIAEAEQLERTERIHEELAPAILRSALFAGETMLRGPLVEIIAGKAVHGAALSQFSSIQNRAAHRLQLDWRDVGTGCGVPAVNYEGARGGGDGLGGHQAMLGQIQALGRLEGALAFMGAFTPGIRRVVLDRIPIPVWGKEAGKQPEDAVAWIRAGLDRLAKFYFPPNDIPTPRKGFLTFGPSRESYEVGSPE